MLTTIKGVYNNGSIILEETPEVNRPIEVLVTFVKPIAEDSHKKPFVFGAGKGMVTSISDDFNEPLEDLKDYM